MKKELTAVKNRIKKLKDKKALIDEELEPLFIREEELENEEIIAICRKNNITISDLMAKVNREKAEVKKEKTNENQFEKEKNYSHCCSFYPANGWSFRGVKSWCKDSICIK